MLQEQADLLLALCKQKHDSASNDEIIKQQALILQAIQKELLSAATMLNHILQSERARELALAEQITELNSSQKQLIVDRFQADINTLLTLITTLQQTITTGNRQQENEQLMQLRTTLGDEEQQAKRLQQLLTAVKNLEYTAWFQRLTQGTAKLLIQARFKIVVRGQEKIPALGPVLLAPRHFHADADPSFLYAIAGRKIFFLAATDWMTPFLKRISEYFFNKLGNIIVHRPDSAYKHENTRMVSAYKQVTKMLGLGQAVVIFPEGYAKIDRHWTPREEDEEILAIKEGIIRFAHAAQRQYSIVVPIIPIGIRYEKAAGLRNIIIVNVGEPIFIPQSAAKEDLDKYIPILQSQIEQLSAQ